MPVVRLEPEPSMTESPSPAFRPASIIVRIDGPSGLAGPHRIDASAARPLEEVTSRDAD